jgi:phage tail sheath protein FI
MPELLTPGVFIQEINFGPQPIEGVSTSTAGFVGETERGPVGQPILITSFSDYQRQFGGFLVGKPLPLAVRGFFDNGGKRVFVVRAAATSISDTAPLASAASIAVPGGYQVQLLAAPQPGSIPANSIIRVASVVGVVQGLNLNLVPINGGTAIPATVVSINATAGTLEINVALSTLTAVKPNTFAVQYTTNVSAAVMTITARDVGFFANNRLQVLLTPVYIANTTIANTTGDPLTFVVTQIAPFAVGQTVEVEDATGARVYTNITAITQPNGTITLVSGTGVAAGSTIRVTGWRLDTFFDGTLVETINNISSANNAADGSGLPQAVNSQSQWVRVGDTVSVVIAAVPVSGTAAVAFPLFVNGQAVALTSGGDGTISDIDFIGIDQAGNRTGLKALEATDAINIIAAPGQTDVNVVGELIGQAERRLDRFAVFESSNQQDITQVLAVRGQFNSRFAAMYHPWVQVLDPATNTTIAQPPAGHVIGCYARTDNDRGVFKAPANVVVQGISGFSRVVVDGEQDLLNPAGVNVLRTFDGLGNVIWGARTISAEGLWKYVSVRRLFIFLEQSIVKGTRFAVFEPNDEILWANIRDAVTNFLTTEWRAGALFGATAAQAFFVKVDETTTTQDDRDNGRVNIIVGIAPVKPAEFIVFQIGQAPNSVIIAEQTG